MSISTISIFTWKQNSTKTKIYKSKQTTHVNVVSTQSFKMAKLVQYDNFKRFYTTMFENCQFWNVPCELFWHILIWYLDKILSLVKIKKCFCQKYRLFSITWKWFFGKNNAWFFDDIIMCQKNLIFTEFSRPTILAILKSIFQMLLKKF